MNRYNASGTAIIDASGKEWTLDTPHSLPLPDGISQEEYTRKGAVYGTIICGPDSVGEWNPSILPWATHTPPTHWLARAPLPPVPKPKTQQDLDTEAFDHWQKTCAGDWTIYNCWNAAIAYERNRIKP